MVYAMYKPIAEEDNATVCALLNLYKQLYRIIGTIILVIGLCLLPFINHLVKEKNFDVSMDVEVFCKYIAPPLGIKVRFAGEEPFDPVTLNYNKNMRRILPEFGMEFCEIPRLEITGNRVVNATEVRRLLKEKKFVEISEYVPDTTLYILKKKYAD